MRLQDLPDLATFAAVARHGSFVRAAAELGLSRSTLSHAVRGLEERLGVRLLNRTTRSVAMTAAGEQLFARLSPALDDISGAVDEANATQGPPRGRIRVNVPRLGYKLVLGPALPDFLNAHPNAVVEIAVEDATVDIVAKGFDAGMRFGERLSAEMIAVEVGPEIEFVVVGSTEYLTRRPPLKTPEDLRDHACIGHRMLGSGRLFEWEFAHEGREIAVAVNGPLVLDAPEMMLDAALCGIGLCYTTLSEAEPLLAAGRLERVLADWCAPASRLHLYYPGRRQVPPLLRALIGWLRHDAEAVSQSTVVLE